MEPLTVLVTTLGGQLAASAADQVTTVVREFVGLPTAERKLLESIGAKVDDLVTAPYHEGCDHLSTAMLPWRTPEQRISLLERARDNFVKAASQQRDPLLRSFAYLGSAITWLAQGSPRDASLRLRLAHLDAAQAYLDRRFPPRQNLVATYRGFVTEVVYGLPEDSSTAKILAYADALALARRKAGASTGEAPTFSHDLPYERRRLGRARSTTTLPTAARLRVWVAGRRPPGVRRWVMQGWLARGGAPIPRRGRAIARRAPRSRPRA